MKKLLSVFIIMFFIPLIGFAQEETAIEILHENGVIRGDGESLAPERYMTYGEFAAAASRLSMYDYIYDYEEIEESLGDWKEATLFCAGILCSEEAYENLEANFDEPASPEFAQDILLGMLMPHIKSDEYIGYMYWVQGEGDFVLDFEGLAALGYDMSVIPASEYITREQGCEMLYELFYIKFPIIGDYAPGGVIAQYTPQGLEVVEKIDGDDILSADMFGK